MRVLEARTGTAFALVAGQTVSFVNTHGQQVVDTWAFAADDPGRTVCTGMTRMRNGRIGLGVGDLLVDTTRATLLEVVADTSPGAHDLLMPSCDPVRYRELGAEGYHANCHDNFLAAVEAFGAGRPPLVPMPVNLFMRVPVEADGSLSIQPPTSRPGDQVTLRATEDVVVVASACPQDMAPTNGAAAVPADVEIRFGEAPGA
ncbi:urea carboxylase-associated family protein [Streptomyces sp. AJS327]|uniref:DUF1989 domain-containing protein n=1 Tax=Streptomyces sp. AJS327 TaxID=2545265 RepID=UPI0015DD86DF|nr:urea carboxylase-associated family protein [Streptomyces sp. AJS327]MBA0050963.1 urea carboxylase-associated family protein [Streptomyces sp. AJS327]